MNEVVLMRLTDKWATRIYGSNDGTELDELLSAAMLEAFKLGAGQLGRAEAFEVPACPLGCTEHEVCATFANTKEK